MELEAKLHIREPGHAHRMRTEQLFGQQYTLGDVDSAAVRDLYIDTEDVKLLRHGYALRVRQRNGDWIIGLKSLAGAPRAGIHKRQEVEGPLHGVSPAASDAQHTAALTTLPERSHWPPEVRRIVRKLVGKKAQFHALCVLQQARDTRPVYQKPDAAAAPDGGTSAGAPVAELSVDSVRVHADPAASTAVAHFDELEIEWTAAPDEAALQAMVAHLQSEVDLAPVRTSKFERALRAVGAHLPGASAGAGGIQPTMHMADACRLLWRQQLVEMVLNEAGVRSDDDAAFVHDMRVAIRRARAAYVLFGDHFQRKQVRGYMRNLRRTARLLGAVRDLDVALEKLARHRKQLPKAERTALKPLAKHWQRQRRAPREALLEWLDSAEYSAFLAAYRQFCQTPGAGAKHYKMKPGQPPPRVQVRHVLPSGILNRFEAVRRYEVVFEHDEPVPIDTLHALRLDCKYLRYILEFARDLMGEEGRQLIRQLKRLQDLLGDLNDAAVAQAMLQEVPDDVRTAAVDQYMAEQDAIIAELRASAPAAFRAFVAGQNRQLLASAIAHI
jgi:CHAD domain-containing protein